jgi:galactose mutarotase-like enzyme
MIITDCCLVIYFGKLQSGIVEMRSAAAERKMRMIRISSNRAEAVISEAGAELQSLRSKETGTEYIWQADPAVWGKHAPNLFPFIGRLEEKKYTFRGKTYSMTIHGFLQTATTKAVCSEPSHCCLELTDSEETRKNYPFRFRFRVDYRLDGETQYVRYEAENLSDAETMYCAMGGHPGFCVPVGTEPKTEFEDWNLIFSSPCSPVRITFDDSVLVKASGEEPFALTDGRILALRHDLFDHDAVVLRKTSGCVTISSVSSPHGVEIDYHEMPYVGFWHKTGVRAPYVCVEPWSALPGRSGVIEDLETMPGLTAIPAGEKRDTGYSIAIF